MPSEYGPAPTPFSVEDLMLKGRNGPFPDGYLNAYLAHLRRSHAVVQAEIDRIFAEAADDPAELAWLHNLLF
ncbi:MAG: hypothetical protein GC203_09905 [Phenylobacterium sp.]|uniref:hypothetical protein n=1 Tax=Phenylobacterium sp. TaxID=1871053 RepID=UPI0025FA107F|nr:hypothetical protein [Phenylobacterium sp.]MBI1198164.1 hypothetical protein [Phenylobacterium sp.]